MSQRKDHDKNQVWREEGGSLQLRHDLKKHECIKKIREILKQSNHRSVIAAFIEIGADGRSRTGTAFATTPSR